RGREAGEHLRPARRVVPERVEMPAVDPGRALSLLDGVLLPAKRGSRGEVDRRGKPHAQLLRGVQTAHELVAAQLPGKEGGLVRDSWIVRGPELPIRSRRRCHGQRRSERRVQSITLVVLEALAPLVGDRLLIAAPATS